MSRIGKMPITIPKGVKVELNNNKVKVSGERGTLERNIHSDIQVKIEEDKIYVSRPSDGKFHRSLHGLSVDRETKVIPSLSSITWAYICFRLLKIHNRGLSLLPDIFLRTLLCLLILANLLSISANISTPFL